MTERLAVPPAATPEVTGKRRLLWLMLALGLAGLVAYFAKSTDVFPSASIELKLPRQRILLLSKKWAESLGSNEPSAIQSTVFSFDDNTKTFLEYELGLPKANVLMKERIPIWYWSTRLCKPLSLEEFTIALSPVGRLVCFDHSLENDRGLPSVSHDEARQMAEKFVRERAQLSLDAYKPVEDGQVSQAKRTDHYFTWEDMRDEFKGARLRISCYVAGNMVSSFNQFLYIPETWLRKFSELRSYNRALEEVASIFHVTFNTATFFAFIWVFTTGNLRWRFALAMAALFGLMDFLESLNSMPAAIRNYTTTMSYNGYMLDVYLSAAWSALWQSLQAFLLAGAAEGLYRIVYPRKIALERVLSDVGLRSRQVLYGLTAGHALFGMHVGWIIVYYLFGRELGVWSPLEVRNVEGLSNTFPFFSAAYVGASASFFEELTYRVLAMSILQKLVGRFWLANLLQAAAWAFMHSTYPQEPPYARGVELTAVGVVYGGVLRSFGLLACVCSHYVFDAFLGVAPLLTSSQPGLQASALVAIGPFLAVLATAAWLTKTRGRNVDEQPLSNASIPVSHGPSEIEDIFPATPYQYKPLSVRIRQALVALAVFAALVEFGYFFPLVGQNAELRISRADATEAARRYMLEHGLSPKGHFEATWLAPGLDSQAMQYIFEKEKFAKTQELATVPSHPLLWQVRFFKPLDPAEFLVTLDARGRPLSCGVVIAEDAPGARLSRAETGAKVEGYLRSDHPEMVPIQLEDASETRRKNRTDWDFRYEVRKYKVAEAEYKVMVTTAGGIVSGYDQSWQLPDKWLWERSQQTTKDQICRHLVEALTLVALVAAIWWAVGVARSGAIRWRPPVLMALAVSLMVVPQALNSLPEFFVGYGNDTPLLSYFIAQGVRQILTAVSAIAMTAGLSAFGLASFRLMFPRTSPAAILKTAIAADTREERSKRFNFWLDAVLIGYAFGIGQRALVVVWSAVHAYISPVATLAPIKSVCTLANVLNPAFDVFLDALSGGVSFLLLCGVLIGLYAKYFRSVKGFLILAAIVSLIYPSTEKYWQDYVLAVIINFAYVVGTWLFIAKLARQNLLAYFLTAACAVVAGSIRVVMMHASTFFAREEAILWLVLISPFIYLAFLRYKASTERPDPESPPGEQENAS